MTVLSQSRIAIALVVCIAGGCRLFPDETLAKGHSPLHPAKSSPDSVAMEIIWARFPANDPVLDDAAWREIDETQIDPSVRRELLNNGLRAGVISGSVPAAIGRVLHQGDNHAKDDAKVAIAQSAELNNDPIVHGRVLHVRRNQRTEVQASEIYPSLPLLTSRGGDLGGRPYTQAQAMYALRVDPQPDRMALVELTPELHFGEAKWKYSSEEGVLRQTLMRDRKVFDELKVAARLAPGEMLVMMSRPNSGCTLGSYFHTANSADGPQQKLILIRLAEVPTSDTFALEP
jgi:hypothetical protein